MIRIYSICLLAIAVFVTPLTASDKMLEVLRKYEGRWVGKFTLKSEATGYTETFSVEQQYWIADDRLYGLAVSDRKDGLQTSHSETFILKDKFVTDISTDQTIQRYLGVMDDGGVLWVPTDKNRIEVNQLKETIVVEDGKRRLKTTGFDTFKYKDAPAFIIFSGDLVYQE